jgi:CheY-like chemotaxis protein
MASKKHILSVSYDEALLKTRAMILQSAGFDVTSAYGFTDALSLFEKKYDLILICHSLPMRDKTAISQNIRKNNCGQILALRRPGTLPMEQAEWSADASRPELMLRAVCDILGVPEAATSQRKTKKSLV